MPAKGYDTSGNYLANGIATAGAAQPTFSLTYNDQTIDQISVTAGTPPAGDTTAVTDALENPNMSGTFTLWYDANGNGTIDQNAATVSGGTQSEEFVVPYSEIATYGANGVETSGPQYTAEQIQNWLNAFAPVSGYQHRLTFDSTGAVPLPVEGTFALNVGGTTTAPISFDSTNLGTTAANMQTALQNAGFSGAIVTAQASTGSTVFNFNVNFVGTAEPSIKFVPATLPGTVAFTDVPTPVSNATDATVTAIDPGTFVVDFGTATEGLDQSSLLQYLSPTATTLVGNPNQQITFTPTVAVPAAGITGQFALQVGPIETAAIAFNSADLPDTATAIQTALVNAGFTQATVAYVQTVGQTGYTFNVSFGTVAEPAMQYVSVVTTFPATFTNSATTSIATQTLTFDATAASGAIAGQFELGVGAVEHGADHFQQRQSDAHGGQHAGRAEDRRFYAGHRGAGLAANGPHRVQLHGDVQGRRAARRPRQSSPAAAHVRECRRGRVHPLGFLAVGGHYDPRPALHDQQHPRRAIQCQRAEHSRIDGRGHRGRVPAAGRCVLDGRRAGEFPDAQPDNRGG